MKNKILYLLKLFLVLSSTVLLLSNSACNSFAIGALEAMNEQNQTYRSVSSSSSYNRNESVVIKTYSGCDYFVADGRLGFYVLEYYSGYFPYEGDKIFGDINNYGFEKVGYSGGRTGRVYVESYLESTQGAVDEIVDHCNF